MIPVLLPLGFVHPSSACLCLARQWKLIPKAYYYVNDNWSTLVYGNISAPVTSFAISDTFRQHRKTRLLRALKMILPAQVHPLHIDEALQAEVFITIPRIILGNGCYLTEIVWCLILRLTHYPLKTQSACHHHTIMRISCPMFLPVETPTDLDS